MRLTLQDAIETIHLEFGEELSTFQGNTSPFERAHPILEGCLHTELKEPDEKKGKPMVWILAGLLGIVVIGLGVWWFHAERMDARFYN